jgi:hypothetical protein
VTCKLRCRASQQPTIWPCSLIAPATLFAAPQDSARRPFCECVRQPPILTAVAHGDRLRDEDQRFAAELMTVAVVIRFEVGIGSHSSDRISTTRTAKGRGVENELTEAWPMTSLLDMLKETNVRLNSNDALRSATCYDNL